MKFTIAVFTLLIDAFFGVSGAQQPSGQKFFRYFYVDGLDIEVTQ